MFFMMPRKLLVALIAVCVLLPGLILAPTGGVSHPSYAPPTVLYPARGTVDSRDAVSAYDKMDFTTSGMSRVTQWKVEVWKRPDITQTSTNYVRGI